MCKIRYQIRQTKLPGTVCSTCESSALSYTYRKHCTKAIMGQGKGQNPWKSHEFPSFDDMIDNHIWGDYITNVIDYDYFPHARLWLYE